MNACGYVWRIRCMNRFRFLSWNLHGNFEIRIFVNAVNRNIGMCRGKIFHDLLWLGPCRLFVVKRSEREILHFSLGKAICRHIPVEQIFYGIWLDDDHAVSVRSGLSETIKYIGWLPRNHDPVIRLQRQTGIWRVVIKPGQRGFSHNSRSFWPGCC